ncbi:hypothetical protein DFH05DRAFT_1581996 [Lentinula detonsa]|uniref:Aminoglycoside phosphotransferase domain-containing protein n=1 Tax=Lentinula detonsa TaxID=2804962 RepID=A0A9W8NTU7_9AGAR|nr:hypothetical protein DFH05DRAFT_1581996 [Lentinula detonsa]
MLRLGRASSVFFNKLKAPASPQPLFSSFRSSISTARSLPRRALSSITKSPNDLYDYTSGRWVYNDALRHKERKLAFDVDGLCRLAAQSVHQSPTDVVSISKLAEGGFNRTFVVTLRDGRQLVARVPYPMMVPNYYAVASEVAIEDHRRSSSRGSGAEGDRVPKALWTTTPAAAPRKEAYITSSLVPRDPALSRFYIRHPDLQPNNIFVSWSPGSDCKIVSLFDWQHTSILPMFLLAGIPQRLQNHADSASQFMTPPSRPENLDEKSEAQRDGEEYRYRCRLVHYLYVTSTRECSPLHYAAFTDRLYALRGRLFLHVWEELTGGGVPCPLEFDAEDLDEMAVIDKEMSEATRGFEILLQSMRGVGEEGWVPVEDYEGTVAFFKEYKEDALAGAQSAEEREEIMTHWPWDDMDEDMYM